MSTDLKTTTDLYRKLYDKLEVHAQTHLLKYWHELTAKQQLELADSIESIQYGEVLRYFKEATAQTKNGVGNIDEIIQPVPLSVFESTLTMGDGKQKKDYELRGLQEISRGHVGVLLMAGGQGTRLGVSYPKGMFDVDLPSHKTLFQIQAERILKLQRLAKAKFISSNAIITWYIMTSQHTMHQSKEFFKSNNYFGLHEENVKFFEQGVLPCFDFDGKILLDQKHVVAQAPDGNGGIFRALHVNGLLDDMQSRGIKYLHAHSVDNILIRVADPVFVGYCSVKNGDCVVKVCQKSSPTEAVGVVCQVDGVYQVVEYSEISTETAHAVREDGQLKFKDGNICNHLFTLEFLQRIAGHCENKLKVHVAKKKIPYVNDDGVRVTPSEINGIKIEKFVFDVFQFSKNFLVLEVKRDEEFSALKNANAAKKDCPATARQDLFKLHRKFIRNAGGEVLVDTCEISPLLSYAGEGLEKICNGVVFKEPTCIYAPEEVNNNIEK